MSWNEQKNVLVWQKIPLNPKSILDASAWDYDRIYHAVEAT